RGAYVSDALVGLSWAEAVAAAPARDPLSPTERTDIITMFTSLLDGLYVHLPLKRAMYGIDPVQQLRRLHERARLMTDDAFHREIGSILTNLRDAHTAYIAPSSLAGTAARLPFLVEQFGSDVDPRFIVSKIIPELVTDTHFVEGAEIVEWNGVPIADAVRRRGESERGGRPDSAMARALDSLTFRPLGLGPPPDERWVIVGYRRRENEKLREHRFEWRFIYPGPAPDEPHPTAPAAAAAAIHPDRALVRRAKKLSFNSGLWETERHDRVAGAGVDLAANGWITGQFQDNVSARVVTAAGRDCGYLRLWSFELSDDDGFLDEVVRLLGQLPQDGLIVDLRGNPGGLIWGAERLLQLFTPKSISPTRFSIIASDLTRTMSDAPQNRRSLSPWRRTLLDAVGTGEIYSQSVPITPVERCNDIGQVYGGPVVAVVDSTTYSAADLFAAGFADNGIGTVVSVGRATGAGGANVWWADTLNSVLAGTTSQLPRLPKGVSFTLSVRRATRIGASDGAPIEDVGIVGHRSYAMTRNDLLCGNVDLLTFCGRLIESQPATSLVVQWNTPVLTIDGTRLDRIDIYVDGRPQQSHDLVEHLQVTVVDPREEIRVEGYSGENLQQVRTVRLT
ncbi:MAG TPA: S41 family peptidase, partial [Ilumatobacteraceae bacterium]|nr:S41 family peptidase [Ilumatobacteraceae bacterium]